MKGYLWILNVVALPVDGLFDLVQRQHVHRTVLQVAGFVEPELAAGSKAKS